MHTSDFDALIPHMKRAGFLATALAALITSMFGWQLGENFLAKVSLAGLLALCTFIVGYSLVAAYHAYNRKMYGVSAAAVTLFAIGVTVEFMSHTGFTAANRDATIQQASAQTVAYEDSRKTVADAEDKLNRARQDREALTAMDGKVNVKPWRNVSDAQAVIKTAEAHKWFTGITEGCTKTKGPQTRDFCANYQQAKADVDRWGLIAKQEIAILQAEKELQDARKTANVQTAGHTAGASQSEVLASITTASVKPTTDAVFWSGVGISALLALFAIAAGGLLNFIAFAFDTGRTVASHAASAAQAATSGANTFVLNTNKGLEELAAAIRHAQAQRIAA